MGLNITQKIITPNKYSRPQTKLNKVRGIVVHWWAVANGSVNGVVNFYENRKNGKDGFGSAHFIVGLKGEIVQCIPENELAYAVGATRYLTNRLGTYPNNCTLHIEMAHTDMQGHMTNDTWNTSVQLTAHLLKKCGLGINDIYTHNSITGKNCPQLFVTYPSEYTRFKNDVAKVMNGSVPVSNSSASKNYLEKGDRGDKVLELQQKLNKIGIDCGKEDSIFGDGVLTAVLILQKRKGLTPDGLVGNATWDILNKLVAEKDKETNAATKPVESKPSENKTENKGDGIRMYKPSAQDMISATSIVLNRLSNEVHGDKAISSVHREKLLKGELPLDDAIALLYVALERGLIQGEKK